MYVVKPKIGPESLAERLIKLGRIEEVRVQNHNLGYLVKVRFIFDEPTNVERYISSSIKQVAAAVVLCR